MRRSSDEIKTNALVLLAALGIAALYGGLTDLILGLIGRSDAAEIGGLVSASAGGLGLIVAFFLITYFSSENIKQPARWITLPFAVATGIAFTILLIPPTVLSLGYFWRWFFRKTKEKHEP